MSMFCPICVFCPYAYGISHMRILVRDAYTRMGCPTRVRVITYAYGTKYAYGTEHPYLHFKDWYMLHEVNISLSVFKLKQQIIKNVQQF